MEHSQVKVGLIWKKGLDPTYFVYMFQEKLKKN